MKEHPQQNSAKKQSAGISRRSFLAAGMVAPVIIPRHVLGRTGTRLAPSDTLNIAAVGVGGMGQNYIKGCEHENIVAMADVDDLLAAPVYATYPKAKTYRDYRIMLEKEKNIDAVIVGTPDHSHAVIAMDAIKSGKHVYVAKPMTRTIYEARAITTAAKEAGVATQMSVQSCKSDASCKTAEWLAAGAVGQVREVHVWSDRPVWPQGVLRPADQPPIPSCLDWDLWLGPAPERPYHPIYHPFAFRGWIDFGTGALGDMACHALHAFFKELQLAKPASVSASVSQARLPALNGDADPDWTLSRPVKHDESFPVSSIVTWTYGQRGELPPMNLFWYDGGLRPPTPPELDMRVTLRPDGVLFIGDRGVLLTGFVGGPMALSAARKAEFSEPEPTLPRCIDHYREWTEACKGGAAASCEFGFASQVTEVALLGVIAQRTNEYLEWDADRMAFTNNSAANEMLNPPYRRGWVL
ncbi:Gfo/Idh/MocA family oxidoreductase [candidate division KSB1 bacterium]|nr:Gfo/Idh/MocA family oxidoreductase [candidate division KSB1 bacterium]